MQTTDVGFAWRDSARHRGLRRSGCRAPDRAGRPVFGPSAIRRAGDIARCNDAVIGVVRYADLAELLGDLPRRRAASGNEDDSEACGVGGLGRFTRLRKGSTPLCTTPQTSQSTASYRSGDFGEVLNPLCHSAFLLRFQSPVTLQRRACNGKAFSAVCQAKNAGGSKAGREQSSVTTPDEIPCLTQFRHKNP